MMRVMWLIAGTVLSVTVNAVDKVRTLEWSDLMTPEDRQKRAALPEIEHLGEEILLEPGQMGSNILDSGNPLDSDSLPGLGDNMLGLDQDAQQQWREVLTATSTVAELDNTEIRIAGFIVPLEFSDDMVVTEFFLVPYFGACIHVPPPPPNQLIYVTMDVGIVLDAIYDPFWVTGTLTTRGKLNETGYAAYSLKADKVEDYKEEK